MKKALLALCFVFVSGCAVSTVPPKVSVLPKDPATLYQLCPEPEQILVDPSKATKGDALFPATENNKQLILCNDKVKGWIKFYDKIQADEAARVK